MHSGTKYLGGHSDVVGGFLAVDDDDIAGRLPSGLIAELMGISRADGERLYELTELMHTTDDDVATMHSMRVIETKVMSELVAHGTGIHQCAIQKGMGFRATYTCLPPPGTPNVRERIDKAVVCRQVGAGIRKTGQAQDRLSPAAVVFAVTSQPCNC